MVSTVSLPMKWCGALFMPGRDRADGQQGLGKTLQTISLLAWLKCERKITQPHLVVAPKSVVGIWKSEIERYARLSYGEVTRSRAQVGTVFTPPSLARGEGGASKLCMLFLADGRPSRTKSFARSCWHPGSLMTLCWRASIAQIWSRPACGSCSGTTSSLVWAFAAVAALIRS